jgi:SAM-dependent methyltransferase
MLRPPRFLADQLARPRGLFGRLFMGRFLNVLNSDFNNLILQDLAIEPTSRVLEVGFGGGALLQSLCDRSSMGFVAGLELSDEMVARSRLLLRSQIDAGRLELRQGSVESMPFEDGQFDRACAVNAIYFWPDLVSAMREFRRILRPGGLLVLGFLSEEDIGRAGLDRHGFQRHARDAIEKALQATEFETVSLNSGSDTRGTYFSLVARRSSALATTGLPVDRDIQT